jgi:hypothetical protein
LPIIKAGVMEWWVTSCTLQDARSFPLWGEGMFGKFDIWNLSFDLAQDGELTEPFEICYLAFEIYYCISSCSSWFSFKEYK